MEQSTDTKSFAVCRKEFNLAEATPTYSTLYPETNVCSTYPRVLVLDKGQMIEFASPSSLIAERGAFYQMVKDAGLA